MELTNEFRVGIAPEAAWEVLTDVERIAPCMPGAQLQEVSGEEYRGIVKVKVGPITAQYKGAATFVEQDKDTRRLVLRADGRDTRGQGNASALITATLTPDGTGTVVNVVTDLTITGRVAQFGRGVLADVSSKLLGQFVDCLESDLLSGDGGNDASAGTTPTGATDAGAATTAETGGPPSSATPPTTDGQASSHPNGSAGRTATATATVTATSTAATAEAGTSRRIESPEAQPVDLLEAAGVPVAKRAIPIVAAVLVVLLLLRRWRKRR